MINRYRKDYKIKRNNLPEFTLWALTLTLNPKFCQNKTSEEQYNYILETFIKRLQTSPILKRSTFQFELTRNRNIHIHLLIETGIAISSKWMAVTVKYLFNYEDSIFGFYYINPVDDEVGWYRYLNKDPYYYESNAYAF